MAELKVSAAFSCGWIQQRQSWFKTDSSSYQSILASRVSFFPVGGWGRGVTPFSARQRFTSPSLVFFQAEREKNSLSGWVQVARRPTKLPCNEASPHVRIEIHLLIIRLDCVKMILPVQNIPREECHNRVKQMSPHNRIYSY